MDKITYSNIVSEEAYKILYELVQNGKLTEYRYLREMLESEKNKLVQMMDKAPEEVYNVIIEDYLKEVKGISKLVPGLSTAIKDSKNGIELYTYDGKIAEGKEKNGRSITVGADMHGWFGCNFYAVILRGRKIWQNRFSFSEEEKKDALCGEQTRSAAGKA